MRSEQLGERTMPEKRRGTRTLPTELLNLSLLNGSETPPSVPPKQELPLRERRQSQLSSKPVSKHSENQTPLGVFSSL